MALAALTIAILAFREGRTAARAAYRPLIRPVKLRAGKGRHPANYLIVKNYGAGPAMSLMLFEASGTMGTAHPNTILNDTVDVLEPLGPREGNKEWERAGRLVMTLRSSLVDKREYRLLYQDRDGYFHETRFTYDAEAPVLRGIHYLGEQGDADLPARAPHAALVKRRW